MRARGAAILAATITVLAVTSGVAAAKPTFGVVPQDGGLPTAEDLDLMPKAGIGGIRLMASWAAVESTAGIYDWRGLDALVRETTNRGIEPLLFFYGTPEWAARQDGHVCTGVACTVYAPASAETRAAFAAFAGAAARRYGPGGEFWTAPVTTDGRAATPPPGAQGHGKVGPCDLLPICPPPPPPPPPDDDPPPPGEPPCGCTEPSPITTWQIWNEQNSPKYFAPKVSVSGYAQMLQETSAAVRAADPAARIMLGGMWGPGSARKVLLPVKPYLKRLYRVGGIEDSFDAIALHPYSSSARSSVDQVEAARKAVKRAGDRGVRTWITELGWAAAGPKSSPYVKGLKGQARLLERTLNKYERKARSFKLDGVFWYSWRDKPGGDVICDWCGHAGLRKKSGRAKPAWRAFARVARS
jgi:hypothetical protein